MSQYQQAPYQTTVMQPVVVQPVVPVVVPVISGHTTVNSRGPAHIKHGVKCGPCNIGGGCICFMSIYGVLMMAIGLPFLFMFDLTCHEIDMAICPSAVTALSLIGIGAPFTIIGCYLCIKGRMKYNKERSQENTAPSSEPFTNTASPMYVPVTLGTPPHNQYPHGSSGVSYYNANSSLQPGGSQYPGPPSHKLPDKSLAPEYDQQPSCAPPSYSP